MKQDDPKKCTSSKLSRFGYAQPLRRASAIRHGTIILNPFADQVLLASDRSQMLERGLCVIDCSWEKVHEVFRRRFNRWGRRLPLMLAANPVNYGQPGKLSSLEAFSGALFIAGFTEQAKKILGLFKWGPTFLTLNEKPLVDYSRARNADEVRRIEESYFTA